MARKRRWFTPEFKARVALEALASGTACRRSPRGTSFIRTR